MVVVFFVRFQLLATVELLEQFVQHVIADKVK